MSLTKHIHERHPLKRIVHLFLLLGWLLSSQGVAPALCLAVALYDGAHQVKVGAASDGGMTVVLSHENARFGEESHDLLCEMLMVFAAPPALGGSDHVLAFKSVDAISRAQRGALVNQHVMVDRCHQAVAGFKRVMPHAAVGSIQSVHAPAWSPALALKAGKTIMLC